MRYCIRHRRDPDKMLPILAENLASSVYFMSITTMVLRYPNLDKVYQFHLLLLWFYFLSSLTFNLYVKSLICFNLIRFLTNTFFFSLIMSSWDNQYLNTIHVLASFSLIFWYKVLKIHAFLFSLSLSFNSFITDYIGRLIHFYLLILL